MGHFTEEDLMKGIEVIIKNAVDKTNSSNTENNESICNLLLEVYKDNLSLLISIADRAYEDNKEKIEKDDLIVELQKVSCINMIEAAIYQVTENLINGGIEKDE